MIKIALTGGIACGKTQISDLFVDLGVAVIDMDVLSRLVVASNSLALKMLVAEFSSDILTKNGNLNRKKLKEILFQDKKAKKTIETILHPKIIELMNEKISALSSKLVVVVVPLLIEKKLGNLFDKFIVVDCEETTQINRLMNRDELNKIEAENIIIQQISRKKRLNFAKKNQAFIIKNEGENFKKQILLYLEELQNH